jgi:hypothetical protein
VKRIPAALLIVIALSGMAFGNCFHFAVAANTPGIPHLVPISSVEIVPARVTVNVNQTIQFTAVVNGGVPLYTISWGFQQKVNDHFQVGSYSNESSSTTYTFTPTSAGTYVVYFFLKDSLNQTATTFSPAVVTVPSSTAGASFGAEGNFKITSPANTTYNSNTLYLNVTGKVIAAGVRLFMNYSLDGQEPTPFTVWIDPEDNRFPSFFGEIRNNPDIILPQLTDGSHNLTVYANLEAAGTHLAQATVYFTVKTQQPLQSSTPSPSPTPTSSPTQQPQATTPSNVLLSAMNDFYLSEPPLQTPSVIYKALPAVNLTQGQTLQVRWYADLILGVFVFTQEQFVTFESTLPRMQGTGNTPDAEEWASKNGIIYEAMGWANRNGIITYNVTKSGS